MFPHGGDDLRDFLAWGNKAVGDAASSEFDNHRGVVQLGLTSDVTDEASHGGTCPGVSRGMETVKDPFVHQHAFKEEERLTLEVLGGGFLRLEQYRAICANASNGVVVRVKLAGAVAEADQAGGFEDVRVDVVDQFHQETKYFIGDDADLQRVILTCLLLG